MYFRVRNAVSLAALAVVAVACGSDSPTQPTTPQITLNQALAELDLPALNTATSTYGGVSAITPSLTSARCPYSGTAQKFVCATVTSGGLTIDQSFSLLTAGGAPQTAFDAVSTDAVAATTTIAGSYTDQGFTYTADGTQDLTLSGLQSTTHSLDGDGTITVVADDGAGTTQTVTLTETITGLKIPAGTTSATAWPSSGSIGLTLDVDLGDGSTSTTTVTMTFNGTKTVHVTIDDNGSTTSCDVDFTTPAPTCGA
jgi:hypothetical protein